MKIEKKICWRVTRACNLYCKHCLAGYKNKSINNLGYELHLEILTTAFLAGISRITWTGGEPTLIPWFGALIKQSGNYGIQNLITTHGLSLKQELLDSLNPTTDTIRISFDGLEKTHNIIRGGNFFKKSLSAIDKTRNAGIDVEVNITVTQLNQSEIPNLIELLVNNNVSKIVLLSLMNRESAQFNNIKPLTYSENVSLSKIISNLSEIFTSTCFQYNNYSKNKDKYIVIESDGGIWLTSETEEDKDFGCAYKQNGRDRLLFALKEQNLLHRCNVSGSHKFVCHQKA